MHTAPVRIRRLRLTVDCVAEHIEHSRNDCLTHRHLKRLTRIPNRHSASKPLSGCERNSTHTVRVDLLHHLDDCRFFPATTQDGEHRWQLARKLRVHGHCPLWKGRRHSWMSRVRLTSLLQSGG